MRTFQKIEIEAGSPYEMGLRYGRQAGEKIRAGVEEYRRLFAESGSAAWEDIQKYASLYIPVVREKLPDIMEEVRGIAGGAGVDLEDIMVLNCRYEITKFPFHNECTSFAVLPEASAGGTTYAGQNWDYRAGIIDNVVILHIEQPDGTRILGLAEAGQVIRNGFNTHGIGLCANNLQSVRDRRGIGIPVTFLRRHVLSCATFGEAMRFLMESERTVSCNFLLASTTGRAVDIEAYPGGADIVDPTGGILTHANHFTVRPENNALETSPRGERLDALLRERRGSIDVPHIIRCLSDHENYPKAICRHPANVDMRLGMRSITVAGVIYDLRGGVAHICAGPSCEGEFTAHTV